MLMKRFICKKCRREHQRSCQPIKPSHRFFTSIFVEDSSHGNIRHCRFKSLSLLSCFCQFSHPFQSSKSAFNSTRCNIFFKFFLYHIKGIHLFILTISSFNSPMSSNLLCCTIQLVCKFIRINLFECLSIFIFNRAKIFIISMSILNIPNNIIYF